MAVSTSGRPQAPTPVASKPPPSLPKAPAASSAPSVDVPMEPVHEDQPDVHMATDETSNFSFLEMIRAGEATDAPISTPPADLMDISPPQQPYASLDTPIHPSTSTHLRPTIHSPTRPDPDVPMTPEVPSQPFLYHLFAEVFRPLPYIGNLFKIVPDSGWDISTAPLLSKGLDIFRWLFPSSDPGIETTHALTDATPLADMIAACVDVEASFADPMSLSKPQVHPALPDAPPLPLSSPSDRGFPQLLTFLHSHLDSHIRAVQQADTCDDLFASFVVGLQDHHNAGAALHSHLVGCATTDPSAHHLALYVPVGPESPYKGPSDWAPLMVYLAVSFLYPDLPFLVCSPDYVLGAQASIDELRCCLGFSSTLNLFTTHTSLVGSDVLVHLPYPCQFSFYIAPRDPELPPLAPFSYRTPSEVLELISSLTKTHMATQAGMHTRIASGSIDADLYYPYYGFSPDTSADFLVMAYQLSSFLVHCCYTAGGAATSALEDELNSTPEDLLTVLASAYKQWTSLHPGQGVFIGPLTADTATLRPFPMAWLYSVDESSPAPPVFGRLSDVFSAGTELYTSPLFQGPICLGPAASLHLNPILLAPNL